MKLLNLCMDLFQSREKPAKSDKLTEFFGEIKGHKRKSLGKEMLEFLSRRKINLAVGLSREQDNHFFPRYEVRLMKDGTEECFTVLGNPEDGCRIMPEDAVRALHIRIQMHELGECLPSSFESTCVETAARLRRFFGLGTYYDFLNLGNARKSGRS